MSDKGKVQRRRICRSKGRLQLMEDDSEGRIWNIGDGSASVDE